MRRVDLSSHEMPFLEHLEDLRWRIIWSALAFVASVAALFAYAVVVPVTLPFLITLMKDVLNPMITGQNYFGLLYGTMLGFGFAFELPFVILLLTAAGLVSPQILSRFRRHAVVLIVAASAFLTPGDFVWGTLALSGPLYMLYELSVPAARMIWSQRNATDTSVVILFAPLLLLKHRRSATVTAA
jgi:sec-independent protein translocase protein TatC